MKMCDEDKSNDDIQEPTLEDKFSKLFCELEHCNEDEQRKIIEEMNGLVKEVNEEEHKSIFTTRMFDKIYKMIEEKKMTMENAILLLKHVGHCKVLKNVWNPCFDSSSLNKRFEKMIFEEEKKEEKNEKLLVDLCECYLLLGNQFNSELILICVPCLLKAALNKEENEKAQKDVEIALLALNNVGYCEIEQELYLNETKEIIEYHQEHRNLTQLAHHSAWDFLLFRFLDDYSLEGEIVNELHFGREAARELEELLKYVDWNRKKGEERGMLAKEELMLVRSVEALGSYFLRCKLWNEENAGLINSIVQVYRAAKENDIVISDLCLYSLRNAAENPVVKVKDLLKGGAVYAILEEMHQPTLDDETLFDCLIIFMNVSMKLKEKTENKMEEVKRKSTKMETFEKMEEEGYEDTITTFHKIFGFLYNKYYGDLSLKISDYFVNV
ncbi:uncharacterized protein MONOS_9769 [Monocercomonoides exilis]|uniref:uncharacterized protein n=1 Tax=Monocercomonoides exilis TaxID=2049356 RepID=UPI003559B208|nr:hypothetical protein MONOS_9769 [Monocercomonoides exilis]|eukprot:MONOS_9769.1-p1 / transcript=MONOS_9769.1 / gene=MONOS_9769 / organism=Monocercomonoides_exilis_PA203 / gene_product=unspecified product / transcript_product=unspecified product / location=Mono_scaffold00416:22851-24290(-) / protein_length=441 / sequence_SO=supercontig / SO=protein_coding / is_pseudo=false